MLANGHFYKELLGSARAPNFASIRQTENSNEIFSVCDNKKLLMLVAYKNLEAENTPEPPVFT